MPGVSRWQRQWPFPGWSRHNGSGVGRRRLAFIAFVLMIIGSAILLLDDRQFTEPWSTHLNVLPLTAFMVFIVLAVGNVISTLLICGRALCPDSPSGYVILNDSLSLTQLSQAF